MRTATVVPLRECLSVGTESVEGGCGGGQSSSTCRSAATRRVAVVVGLRACQWAGNTSNYQIPGSSRAPTEKEQEPECPEHQDDRFRDRRRESRAGLGGTGRRRLRLVISRQNSAGPQVN